MSDSEARLRREPPRFAPGTVAVVERLTPRMVRVALDGVGIAVAEPAASVRVLLPVDGGLVMPTWNGNEFLLPDGSRPPIRTVTPWPTDGAVLAFDVVLHGAGPLSAWAQSVKTGDVVAVSGPGRGYEVDQAASHYVVAGDESALPGIQQVLDALPEGMSATVHVELGHPDGRLPALDGVAQWHVLPDGARPGDALVDAVLASEIPEGAAVWVAGEAAAVQRIRKHLFDQRGLPRGAAAVRGYWKLV